MKQVYLGFGIRGFKKWHDSGELQKFFKQHPEAERRWHNMCLIHDGILNQEQAARVEQVSVRTIQRWWKMFNPRNPRTMSPKSKSPHSRPRKETPPHIRERVLQVARENLSWGGDLVHDYIIFHDPPDQHISLRTVERILAKARKNKQLRARVRLIAANRTKKKRKNHVEITRVYKSTRDGKYPGDRVNQDVVIAIIWKNGIRVATRYFSNVIDRFSRAAIVRVSDKLSGGLSKQAHQDLEELIQMPIKCSISDNGAENLGEMREFCLKNGKIQLFTYPSSPKQNAIAERFNKTFQEDFLLAKCIDLSHPIDILQEEINNWLVFYNTERPHQKVNRRPPIIKLFQFHLQNFISSTVKLNNRLG